METLENLNLDNVSFYKSVSSWLKGTEDICRSLLLTFDSNADFQITPSLDVGFPNDVFKVAGGFLSGCSVDWKCSVPFIPVDASVHVCTSSVFKLGDKGRIDSPDQFKARINKMILNKNSFDWNFNLSNHFILLVKDESSQYLVMHSCASEYKKSLDAGLLPVRDNWYWDKLSTYSFNGRYLRYLSGRKAEGFFKIAQRLPEFSKNRHIKFAELFVKDITTIEEQFIAHHYGMPDNNSINLACYVLKKAAIVPIFTAPGKNIFLYKVGSDDPEVNEYKIIPHGWGKSYKDLNKISLDTNQRFLILGDDKYLIESDDKIRGNYRSFSDASSDDNYYFSKTSKSLSGEVHKCLEQIYSYSSNGIISWKS